MGNYKKEHGFRVTNFEAGEVAPCTDRWNYKIQPADNGTTCHVTILQTTSGLWAPGSHFIGDLKLNRYCIHQATNHYLTYDPALKIQTDCTCRTPAWLEFRKEILNVSPEVK